MMQIQRNVLLKNDKIMISRQVASIDFFKAKSLQYFRIRFCVCVTVYLPGFIKVCYCILVPAKWLAFALYITNLLIRCGRLQCMLTLEPFIPLREVLHSMVLNFNRANYPRFVTSPG